MDEIHVHGEKEKVAKERGSEWKLIEKQDLGIRAVRSFAADYSGASGAPCLVAVGDRLMGTQGRNTWQMSTERENKASCEGNTFLITAPSGATLKGTVVKPAGAVARVIEAEQRHEINYHGSSCNSRAEVAKFRWPDGVEPTGVRDEWIERGPARVILKRTFAFKNPEHRYALTIDCRAGDPWIGIVDEYSLGKGTSMRLDLTGLGADKVFHPYAYNARTFMPGGDYEDTTLQPPQHPISPAASSMALARRCAATCMTSATSHTAP